MTDVKNILIVEDSTLVALHLRKTLELKGYRVLASLAHAEKALEFIENQHPDLVIMDIMLKGTMDGIDAAKQIKEDHGIPILILSALTDSNTMDRIKAANLNHYMSKPFEDDILHEEIQGMLG